MWQVKMTKPDGTYTTSTGFSTRKSAEIVASSFARSGHCIQVHVQPVTSGSVIKILRELTKDMPINIGSKLEDLAEEYADLTYNARNTAIAMNEYSPIARDVTID